MKFKKNITETYEVQCPKTLLLSYLASFSLRKEFVIIGIARIFQVLLPPINGKWMSSPTLTPSKALEEYFQI